MTRTSELREGVIQPAPSMRWFLEVNAQSTPAAVQNTNEVRGVKYWRECPVTVIPCSLNASSTWAFLFEIQTI